jgi:uncharacterized protein (TIGR03086 family)
MDASGILALARSEFEKRLRGVGDDQWGLPTPCEGWSVRELVNHVVAADRMYVPVLDGCSAAEALEVIQRDWLGDDPVAAFTEAADAQAAAFAQPGVFERTGHHPAGDLSGFELFGFRVADYTLHAWDLARATGGDEHLDDELVALVWAGMQPMAAYIGNTGFFGSGPSGAVGDDAPLQVRLLDMSGRRP